MSLVHIRVISPAPLSQQVEAVLTRQPGATNIVVLRGAAQSPAATCSRPTSPVRRSSR